MVGFRGMTNVKFEWGEECQRSFDKLKAFLTEAPVLTQPTCGKEYVIFSALH